MTEEYGDGDKEERGWDRKMMHVLPGFETVLWEFQGMFETGKISAEADANGQWSCNQNLLWSCHDRTGDRRPMYRDHVSLFLCHSVLREASHIFCHDPIIDGWDSHRERAKGE